ncbi:hypothetical protein M388_11280 [Mesotoga sp. Brook.08.YT.4.2.5.4.]|nr:hypothetical protein M388_11280 [Mesotoga sp. Brook.08.YT.4.2.5.4.]
MKNEGETRLGVGWRSDQENYGPLSGFPLAKKKELDAETSSA